MQINSDIGMQAAASVTVRENGQGKNPQLCVPRAHYAMRAFDKHGNLKWTEEFDNVVVNEGLNDLLDKYFKGSSYTAGFFVGLIDSTPTPAAGHTAAQIGGTNVWDEITAYDESTREALTLGTVSSQSVDNSASVATFTISGTVSIGGAFLITNSTKGGTSGVLYSAAAFTGGDRDLVDDDSLEVTVTLTAAAA